MTDTTKFVRAACDAQPDRRADVHCIYPHCKCVRLGFEDTLTTLIAQARAAGAEEERRECAALANDIGTQRWHGTQLEDACDEVAAAIRARTQSANPAP